MNLLEILHNKELQQKINKEYQIKVDYNKIKWVANITLVETAIFILLTYFKECYNIGANELSYLLSTPTPREREE